MNKIIAWCDQALSFLSRLSALAAGVLVYSMMAGIVVYVILRKLGIGVYFVEEYSGYSLVFMAYIGLAYTFRTGGHIRVDIVFGRLKPMVRAILEIAAIVAGLIILYMLSLETLGNALFSLKANFRSSFLTESPLWPFQLFIPMGLTILGLEMFLRLMVLVREVIGQTITRKTSVRISEGKVG